MSTKTLLKRIDYECDGIHYKTIPTANVICDNMGHIYAYSVKNLNANGELDPTTLYEICKGTTLNQNGYIKFNYKNMLTDEVVHTTKHRAIGYAFGLLKDQDDSFQINHIDHVRTNCVLSNLEPVTRAENLKDRDMSGRMTKVCLEFNGEKLYFKSQRECAEFIYQLHNSASIQTITVELCNAIKDNRKAFKTFDVKKID